MRKNYILIYTYVYKVSLIIKKRNGMYLKKFLNCLTTNHIRRFSSSSFERVYRQYLEKQLSNVKSTTWREIVRSVERRVSPSSAKLLSMTKGDTVKSLYVAFPSARACSPRSTGEAWSFLQFFFFFFPSLLSATKSRVSRRTMRGVRQRQRRMEKWHGTTELCTGRVIFTGRKWSNGGNESSSSPLHPSSSIFSLLCIPPVARDSKPRYIFLAADKPIRRHHRRVSTVKSFELENQRLDCARFSHSHLSPQRDEYTRRGRKDRKISLCFYPSLTAIPRFSSPNV